MQSTNPNYQYAGTDEVAKAFVDDIDIQIRASAFNAGIKDLATLQAIQERLIERNDKGFVTNAEQVVKELKGRRPELFQKPVSAMTAAEYEEARRRVSGVGRAHHLI